jgi:hypothetical protein
MWFVGGVDVAAAAAGAGPSLPGSSGVVTAPFGVLGGSVVSCCRRAPTPLSSGCSSVGAVELPRGLCLCHEACSPDSLGDLQYGPLPLGVVGMELLVVAVGATAAVATDVKPTGVGACRAVTADPLIGGARHEVAVRPMPSWPRATLAHVPPDYCWGVVVGRMVLGG